MGKAKSVRQTMGYTQKEGQPVRVKKDEEEKQASTNRSDATSKQQKQSTLTHEISRIVLVSCIFMSTPR